MVLKKIVYFLKDHSKTVYTEMLDYEDSDIQRVMQFAKHVVDEIPVSNHNGKRGIFSSCIEYYRGINHFIIV